MIAPTADVAHAAPPGLLRRARLAAAGVGAALLGAAPHVLHHAGPLAGAALFAGFVGTLLFGLLGLVAALPMLVRMRRRAGSWRAPSAALALFAALFALSSFVVGPAITGSDDGERRAPASPRQTDGARHEEHHR